MRRQIPTSERLIVALDVDSRAEAWGIVDPLDGIVSFKESGCSGSCGKA